MSHFKNYRAAIKSLKEYAPNVTQLLILPIIGLITLAILLYLFPMIPYGMDIAFSSVLSLLVFTIVYFFKALIKYREQKRHQIAKYQSYIFNCMELLSEESTDDKHYISQFSDYEKGTFSKPKGIYDSKGEKKLDEILHTMINQKYQFGKKFGLRVLIHQPLSNYVKCLKQKTVTEKSEDKTEIYRWVNNKNHWTHFDFIIEARKGHRPLLAIELDGPFHNSNKQKSRDEYKNGVCQALNIPLIRINYNGNDSQINIDYIENNYEEEIIQKLISSLQENANKSENKIRQKYNGNSPQDELIRKFL